MPLVALATAVAFAVGRSASEKSAKKQQARASQRGLHFAPETDRNDVNSQSKELEQDTDLAPSRPGHAESMEDTKESDSLTTLAETYETLSSEPSELPARDSLDTERRPLVSSHHGGLSMSSGSASSYKPGVRVRTTGNDLKSGFPYHARLYDLRVRPDDWQRFSDQVTDAGKFSPSDYAKMWAAAGSVALTDAVLTTTWVGRTIDRSIQEKKVSSGLVDMSQGSLGDVLQQWNQSYFAPLGLHARLELSDSAMRKPKKKSKVVRRPSLTYSSKEEREWRNEDRKFVVVVDELISDMTSEHVNELSADPDKSEMPVLGDPRGYVSELPGDSRFEPLELSSNGGMAKEKLVGIVSDMAELPANVPAELPVDGPHGTKLDDRTNTVRDSLESC